MSARFFVRSAIVFSAASRARLSGPRLTFSEGWEGEAGAETAAAFFSFFLLLPS
jgi:hypothetical protein